MIMWFCKKAYYYLFKKNPDDILEIMDLLADGKPWQEDYGKDYHEIATEMMARKYIGPSDAGVYIINPRNVIKGIFIMLAACYLHVNYVRTKAEAHNA